MKKSIYMMLNDISTDTSGYGDTHLSEEDLNRFRGTIKKRLKKKRRKRALYLAAASAACVVILAAVVYLLPRTGQIKASGEKELFRFSSVYGMSKDIESESLRLNQNRKMREGSVTLESVVADEGQLTVQTMYFFQATDWLPDMTEGGWVRGYASDFKDTGSYLSAPVKSEKSKSPSYIVGHKELPEKPYIQRLYINGKEVRCNTDGNVYAGKRGMLQDTTKYYFPVNELEFPAEVQLEIWKDTKQEKAEAVFEFTLSKDNIISNEAEAELDQTVILEDGRKMKFEKFIYNAQGAKIYATCENQEDQRDNFIMTLLECSADGKDYYENVNSFFETQISEKEFVYIPEMISDLYYVIREEDGKEQKVLEFDIEQCYFDKNKEAEWVTKEKAVKVVLE